MWGVSQVTLYFLLFGMFGFAMFVSAHAENSYGTRVCIVRPGENGRVNMTPVTVRISEMAELTILGEQEICVGVNATERLNETISLRFLYPYGGPNERLKWWRTEPIPVSIKSGKTTRILLCERDQDHSAPGWTDTGWHKMWMLLPYKEQSLCAS